MVRSSFFFDGERRREHKRFDVQLRVIHGYRELQIIMSGTRVALQHVPAYGARETVLRQPGALVDANCVNHEDCFYWRAMFS